MHKITKYGLTAQNLHMQARFLE